MGSSGAETAKNGSYSVKAKIGNNQTKTQPNHTNCSTRLSKNYCGSDLMLKRVLEEQKKEAKWTRSLLFAAEKSVH